MIAPHVPLLVWLASAAPTASERALALRGAVHVRRVGAAGFRVDVRLTVPDRAVGRLGRDVPVFVSVDGPACTANVCAVERTGIPASAVFPAMMDSEQSASAKPRAESNERWVCV